MRTAVARINGPGGDRCTDDLRGTQAEEAHTARPRKGWSLLPLNLLSMVPERNLVSPRNDGPAGADTGRSATCIPTHCRILRQHGATRGNAKRLSIAEK